MLIRGSVVECGAPVPLSSLVGASALPCGAHTPLCFMAKLQ